MNGELIAFTLFFATAVVVVLAELLSLEPHPAATRAVSPRTVDVARRWRLINTSLT
jgi:hypothetical protein